MRLCVVFALLAPRTAALLPAAAGRSRRTAARAGAGDGGEDYVNPVTALLGRFIPKPEEVVIDGVDFAAAKTPLALPAMAEALDAGLRDREWFVTGRVLPNLFADGFEFKDPDVQLKGIDTYASGVARLMLRSAMHGRQTGLEKKWLRVYCGSLYVTPASKADAMSGAIGSKRCA